MLLNLGFTIEITTRYAETDQMGYIHHSVYPVYLEYARIEWFKTLGISYKELEANGILLPVYKMNLKFLFPLTFDETIQVRVKLTKIRGARLGLEYQIFNENKTLATEAYVELVFANSEGKPIRPPKDIVAKFHNPD